MNSTTGKILTALGLAAIGALIGLGLWLRHAADPPLSMAQRPGRYDPPVRIMSTEMRLTALVPPAEAGRAEDILDDAEAAARLVESAMDIHNPDTELAQFNAAPAGRFTPLSHETLVVLTAAREIWMQSECAFDVTARPLFNLWRRCEKENRLPRPAEMLEARRNSLWEHIDLQEDGAVKVLETASVDLGGIAKGYALDLAAEKMIAAGCVGGIVDIGGDVRCFGHGLDHKPWRVGVTNPFSPERKELFVLAVRDAAICTSGDYERYERIQNHPYSHIKDPRPGPHLGMAVASYPSVTVIAPDGMAADAWATALSVLGPEGLRLLEGTDIEALLICGTAEDHTYVCTAGFESFVARFPPDWPRK